MKRLHQLSVFVLSLLCASMCFAAAESLASSPINEAQAKASIQAQQAPDSHTAQLSTANEALIKKNALLEQDNTALQTQVNVLTNERSNQLFMTGAFVAMGGIFLGFIAAWLMIGRRQNW